jgi:Mn2+/Fe2+ NRAMP family transporter
MVSKHATCLGDSRQQAVSHGDQALGRKMNDNFMLFATLYIATCLFVFIYFYKSLKPATFMTAVILSPVVVFIIFLVGLYELPKALIQAIRIKQTPKQPYVVEGFYILSAEELRENDS